MLIGFEQPSSGMRSEAAEAGARRPLAASAADVGLLCRIEGVHRPLTAVALSWRPTNQPAGVAAWSSSQGVWTAVISFPRTRTAADPAVRSTGHVRRGRLRSTNRYPNSYPVRVAFVPIHPSFILTSDKKVTLEPATLTNRDVVVCPGLPDESVERRRMADIQVAAILAAG